MARRSAVTNKDGRRSEHGEQCALFQWAALSEGRRPELRWMYAIPNGGDRNPLVGAKMKAEGQKAGVPDVCLPVARGGFIGLYIENKVRPNKVAPGSDQEKWLEGLAGLGHCCVVCWSADDAIDVIERYLEGKIVKE